MARDRHRACLVKAELALHPLQLCTHVKGVRARGGGVQEPKGGVPERDLERDDGGDIGVWSRESGRGGKGGTQGMCLLPPSGLVKQHVTMLTCWGGRSC